MAAYYNLTIIFHKNSIKLSIYYSVKCTGSEVKMHGSDSHIV